MNRIENGRRRVTVRVFSIALGLAACAVCLVPSVRASADPATSASIDSANRAFGAGHTAEAVAEFERLVAQRGYSAPLLFDLGNAYLKAGDPVRAVLAYERAQQLSPGDNAIAANLSQARAAMGISDPRGRLERLPQFWSVNTWAWLASAGFFLCAGAALARRLARHGRAWLTRLGVVGASLFATSVTAVVLESRALDRALVLAPTAVLVSPFESAQSDFALSAGSEVQLVRTRDKFAFVRDGHGRSGWVERARIEPLIPGRS